MWYVTVPELAAVIEFFVILEVIVAFGWVFDYVFVMTGGGPINSTVVGEFFVYKYAFQFHRMDIASAMAVFYLLGSFVLMAIRSIVARRVEET
jgi:ABC-type sugar transport system permease subunit